ncbi:MAG: hypothetical protein ACI85O_003438 [Saprospiraceae bacterium]|jgi:hypothetical protein
MHKFSPAFLLLVFCFISSAAIAQTSVSLKINHKLGNSDFAFDTESSNNLDNPFDVTRMEYYMSGFTVYHDGISTAIENFNVLVRASQETTINLGMIDATDITQIRFHIGIGEGQNHGDPASYQANNPLSPQFPSMHWGWAAGYRFIAMEGNVGTDFNSIFELHGLGDSNYFETRTDVTPTTTSEGIIIELDADYARALEGIDMSQGVISHGETGEAKTAVENFKDYVFSQAGSITEVTDYSAMNTLQIFPNPTATNTVNIFVDTANDTATQLELFRADGSLVNTTILNNQATATIKLDAKGFYFLRVSQDGKTVGYEKVVAQ